ncbi:MerR family transcriptional regulator [Oerskovia paurometabola]|uniref:MerR family transcriptional regulator n=1 Tax=Oerskovia paurometabola TaxID=162170 RepID=UPI0038100892
MDEYTTGQVARTVGLSEKAVRLYVDRGLLDARRASDERRLLGPDQLAKARLIRLLRAVGLSLAEVELVLGSSERVSCFDDLWSERRASLSESLVAGEYVRSVLFGSPRLDVEVQLRQVSERLVLGVDRRAGLDDLPQVLAEGTDAVFAAIAAAGVNLDGPPFVEYHERATEGYAARITVCAPVDGVLRPPTGFRLSTDAAHAEAFVEVDAAGARDQERLVLVHDYLSSGVGLNGTHVPVGDNREVYLPSWGTGEQGPVMEVAVPVTAL